MDSRKHHHRLSAWIRALLAGLLLLGLLALVLPHLTYENFWLLWCLLSCGGTLLLIWGWPSPVSRTEIFVVLLIWLILGCLVHPTLLGVHDYMASVKQAVLIVEE